MELKSLPGSGRFAGRGKIAAAVALAVAGAGAYLTDSDVLWAVVKALAPVVLGGG